MRSRTARRLCSAWAVASGRKRPRTGKVRTRHALARAILQATLNYVPTESLIQHEWATHGTCSGMSAADYFAALRRARDSIVIPSDLK